MAADRAEHVARVAGACPGRGRVGGERPLRRLDHRLPGLRAGASTRPRWTSWSRWATGGLAADLSILVDVSVEVAAGRLAAAGRRGADRMERLGPDFAARVREGFLAQAARDPDRWLVVDGTLEVAALTAHIVASVRERLGDAPAGRR